MGVGIATGIEPSALVNIALADTSVVHACRPVRRPLVGLLIAMIAGLVLSCLLPAPAWFALAWVLLAMTCVPRFAGARAALLFALATACAGAHGAVSRVPPAPDHLANRMRRPMEHIRLVGVVADDPVRETGRRADTWTWRFPIALECDLREAGWRRARGRVEVRLETSRETFSIAYGERWRIEGVVRRGESGLASPPRLSLSAEEHAARKLSGTGGWFLRSHCLAARRRISARFAEGVAHAPDAVALVRALMLGYRHELPPRVREAFAHAGTLHIVAISGAHVGMMAVLILSVVRASGLSRPRWPLVMAPLLLLYAMGTGLAPSAVRACLMAVVFYLAYAAWRDPDSLSALAFAALAILAVVPGQLENPGFILSFSVVAGLILLVPPVRDWLHAHVAKPPEGASALRMRWIEPTRRAGLDLLAVTLVAWVVSTPLVIHFFNLFSPIALIVNLLVMPLAFLILFSASLSIVLGVIHPVALEAFNHAAVVFAQALITAVEASLRAPGAHAYVEAPPVWATGLMIVLSVGLLRGARVTRGLAGAALGALLAGLVWRADGAREFSVAVRHLGPAAVALAKMPGAGVWLIDTGPAFTSPRLIRFLNEQGVDRLRVVAITRGTMEAAGGLLRLLAERRVDEVWVPDVPFRSRVFHQMLVEIERTGVRVVRVHRGMEATVGADGSHWHVLHPPSGAVYRGAASGGVVLRLSHGATAAIFSPGPDARLTRALADIPQDYGGQAVIELGMRGADAGDSPPWRPAVALRPMRPGAQRRAVRDEGAFVIPEGETVRLTARGAEFLARASGAIAPDDF